MTAVAETLLHVLLVEDNPADARLILHELRQFGYQPQTVHVQTEEEFLAQLKTAPDIILCDYSLPQFGALRALELLRLHHATVPLLIISGSIGEETAVAAIKCGAIDYLLKDRLGRLGLAVKQALEHRRLEEQFRQSQKMEAIGRLAGGIAHDFNNLLTVINGYTEMLLADLAADGAHRDIVEQIGRAGQRAAALTRQLLAFSRQQVLMPVVLNLNTHIDEMDKLLERLVGEDIELRIRRAPVLWHVDSDPGQIEQVIMNLVINARDAMPDGGKLTIQTGNVAIDDSASTADTDFAPGEYVLLTIEDTGHGMDQETCSRIFEPFFTTKGHGKGTGLGLATVYGIVRQSGGHIAVSSEIGIGTSFKVYLPRSYAAADSQHGKKGTPAADRGHETILLVEDDPDVSAFTGKILEKLGYQVLTASNGEEAICLCEQQASPIALLLTDVVMPDLSGPQLADQLLASHPAMKVLFLSGYTDDAIIQHGLLGPDRPFLEKPYQVRDLANKIRSILDTTSPT